MDYGVVIINGVFAILRKSLHEQITMEANQREEKLNTDFRPHCPSKIQKMGSGFDGWQWQDILYGTCWIGTVLNKI